MPTNSKRIYDSLAERIINGSLSPGQKLDEKGVAQLFGVSRTPVREALRELSARGLVEFSPRRGGAVAQFGLDNLKDMLDAECELEALCAQLASQRMTGVERGQFQDIHDRSAPLVKKQDHENYLLLNQEFHTAICAGAHNKSLEVIVRDLRDRLAPFRQTQSVNLHERLVRSHQEHANIMRAILDQDRSAAYETMLKHNARLSAGVIRLLSQHTTPNAFKTQTDAAGGDLAAKRAHQATTVRRARLRSIATVSLLCAGLMTIRDAFAADAVVVGLANTSSDVGFFLADKKGYFHAERIDVKFTPFSSAAQMIAPLGIGELDVGGGTVAAGLYNAVERGIRIRIVADKGSVTDGYEFSTLLVRKDLVDSGRYKSLTDLKGMTVATASLGSGSESSLNEALKKAGLKFGDVNVVYMGFPNMHVAFANKGIDAGVIAEPSLTRAIHEGLAVHASPNTIYPGQQTAVVLYSENFAEKRRNVAQRFMLAYLRAIRDYNDALLDGHLVGPKGQEIVATLNQYTDIKDAETYETMTPFAANPNGNVNLESLSNDIKFYQSRGLVGPRMRVEQVVDGSFAEEAVKDIGPYKR